MSSKQGEDKSKAKGKREYFDPDRLPSPPSNGSLVVDLDLDLEGLGGAEDTSKIMTSKESVKKVEGDDDKAGKSPPQPSQPPTTGQEEFFDAEQVS